MSRRRRMNAAASRPAIVRARAGEDRRPPVFGKSGLQSAASCESPLYVPPSLGTGFTGRAEPSAAELAPTAQQRDVGGSGRSWGSSPVERAHDGMNRADDTGSGESVSLSAESGQLQLLAVDGRGRRAQMTIRGERRNGEDPRRHRRPSEAEDPGCGRDSGRPPGRALADFLGPRDAGPHRGRLRSPAMLPGAKIDHRAGRGSPRRAPRLTRTILPTLYDIGHSDVISS